VPVHDSGFALAKSVAAVFETNPKVEGLVLLQHGIFTVGEAAKQAYDRMIEFVTLAEERLSRNRKPLAPAALPKNIARLSDIAPILRGAVAIERNEMAGYGQAPILCFRTSPAILAM